MPAPKTPNTSAAVEAAALAAKRRREEKAAQLLREAGWTVAKPETTDVRHEERCPCRRAAQHQANADELARVRELLSRWEDTEGWTDVETDAQWDAGYKTCWRERASELRDVLAPGAEHGPLCKELDRKRRDQYQNWLMRHGRHWNDIRSSTHTTCIEADWDEAIAAN